MRKSMLLLIPMVLLIVSCGLKLSDNDAKAIIEKELAYPKTISTLINFWDWKDQPITWQAMLDYLIKNGDIVFTSLLMQVITINTINQLKRVELILNLTPSWLQMEIII